jgi:tetratricopeptide (TPR) repeat protein
MMICSQTSRLSSETIDNRSRVILIVLAAALVSLSSRAAFAQSPSPQRSDAITVEGTVRNSAGEPVAGASVLLEEKGHPGPVKTRTNADGTFVLSADHAGTYSIRAEKSGLRSGALESLVFSAGETKHVNLVLQTLGTTHLVPSAAAKSSGSSPGAMEFKDEPNFTVAGVTDWSNAGLHGSDTSSRTSEALTRETLALKSGELDKTSSGAPNKAYDLALAYRAKGDFARAREEVRKTLASADNAEGHRLLGDLDERLGDPLGAVHEYEHAARLDPSEQNYFEWGTELLLHKAALPAVEVFTKGSGMHRNSARMLAGLGAALYASGSYDEAARRICEASDLNPADPAPYLFLGKMEKATSAPLPCSAQKLARFVRDQPQNALANYYCALALWKKARGSENRAGLQESEALLQKAVAIDPKLGEAYVQLGILYSARGSFEQAIQSYRKAIEVSPDLGEAHYRLSLAYKRTGEESKAQQELKTYEHIEKTEAAAVERQRRELRQFLIILKDQPASP